MINWKLRFKNKVVLTAIILQAISIVYQILAAFGVTPSVDQSVVIAIAESVIGLLALIGIVTDPTTEGLSDSDQAMDYEAPKESVWKNLE